MIARGIKKETSEPKSMKLPKRSLVSPQVTLFEFPTSVPIPLIGTGSAMPKEEETGQTELIL